MTLEAAIVDRKYSTNGSITLNADIGRVQIEAWGSGGSSFCIPSNIPGGGGGGGAYARIVLDISHSPIKVSWDVVETQPTTLRIERVEEFLPRIIVVGAGKHGKATYGGMGGKVKGYIGSLDFAADGGNGGRSYFVDKQWHIGGGGAAGGILGKGEDGRIGYGGEGMGLSGSGSDGFVSQIEDTLENIPDSPHGQLFGGGGSFNRNTSNAGIGAVRLFFTQKLPQQE